MSKYSLSPSNPYYVCQFIEGGREFAANAVSKEGRLTLFQVKKIFFIKKIFGKTIRLSIYCFIPGLPLLPCSDRLRRRRPPGCEAMGGEVLSKVNP